MSDERLGKPSASGGDIWINCPAQPNFVKSLPAEARQTETPDSLAGNTFHEATVTGDTSALSEEQKEDFDLAMKHEASLITQWIVDHDFDNTKVKEGPRRTRFFLHDEATAEVILSGEFDKHWLAPGHLLIEDFKSLYCWHLAPAQRNHQLRAYAVLGAQEYDGIDCVRVALNKPKIKSDPLDWCDYHRFDLDFAKASILHDLWETKQPDARFVAGDWCNFCAGKAYCKTAGAHSLLPVALSNGAAEPAAIAAQLTMENIGKLLHAKGTIEKILDAVQDRAKTFSDAELAGLGFQRGKPKQIRSVVNNSAAFGKALDFVPESSLWNCLKFSLPELASSIGIAKGLSKEAARKFVLEQFKDWIEVKETEASLVKIK